MKKRQRGFTIAEVLVAGGASVFVGGIAISAFAGFSSAASLASTRESSSRTEAKAVRLIKDDIQASYKVEFASGNRLLLSQEDSEGENGVIVSYRKDTDTGYLVRLTSLTEALAQCNDGTQSPLNIKIKALEFTPAGEGCVRYKLVFDNPNSAVDDVFVGEARIRNKVKN